MIVDPTTNLRVELIDQIGGRHAMGVFDDSSDTVQEGPNILLGRLDEQFPVRISAHILSEEIKASLGLSAAELIDWLNPKIRGWANYHRHVVSKRIFERVDSTLFSRTHLINASVESETRQAGASRESSRRDVHI